MSPSAPPVPAHMITLSLQKWRAGDDSALSNLASEVYKELRNISGALLNRHRDDVMLQPTMLLHELYLKLPDMRETDWQSRAQFFNTAARVIRNMIIDHARKRAASKRGNEVAVYSIDTAALDEKSLRVDVLVVNDALEKFAAHYPRQARTVELRFFGGLTVEETAEVLRSEGVECSVRTVERDWTFARAWLQKSLGPA